MNAYSYWEQGRDLASGKIISMTPFNPSGGSEMLGSMPLGAAGMTLSAVAQFGIYFEMRRMNRLKEAEFEERRHAWISDISNQWIDEHMDSTGIRRDVTVAVIRECQKMWQRLCQNEMTDVPQTILLKLSRMAEFIEWNYSVAAAASNSIVSASGMDRQWILETSLNSESIALEMVRDHAAHTKDKKGEWWSGPLKVVGGLPLFFVPGLGSYGCGALVGWGIAEIEDYMKTVHVDFETLQDKVPLLQFGIALERLENAARQIAYLLEKQEFKEPMRFAVLENGPNDVGFSLEPLNCSNIPGEHKVPLKPIAAPIYLPVLVK